MKTFSIQQRASVYYEIEVEARSLEEAIDIADNADGWSQTDVVEFEDDYWYSMDGGTTWKERK